MSKFMVAKLRVAVFVEGTSGNASESINSSASIAEIGDKGGDGLLEVDVVFPKRIVGVEKERLGTAELHLRHAAILGCGKEVGDNGCADRS